MEALKKLPGLQLIILNVTSHPDPTQAEKVVNVLKEQKCQIVFTIDEMGLDAGGVIADFIMKNNLIHINWCVDDPFYEEIMMKKKVYKYSGRIDFVSDKDYIGSMNAIGLNAHFLPLATDPEIYHPIDSQKEVKAAFVGNSYTKQIDDFTKGLEPLFEIMFPCLSEIIYLQRTNCGLDIEKILLEKISSLTLPPEIGLRKAVFVFKHITSFMHRKEMVKHLAKSIDGFMVYGDASWLNEIDKSQLGFVSYGEKLAELYNKTSVNIDINRIVIRNGFTQRVFDCLACKSFMITGKKPIVPEFFETEGDKKELVTFGSVEELVELVKYYLKHETEREQIAERGYQKVMAQHTYDHRINKMFQIISKELLTN